MTMVTAAEGEALARSLVEALASRGLTIGTCESLTGGGIAATITSVPGASAVLRGGLVTYASDLKVSLAGVDARHVAEHGVVDESTASQMAVGARRALGTDWAVSCTGVAGPDMQDGQPVGSVFIGLAGPEGVSVRHFDFSGDRAAIRLQTIATALRLSLESL